jgi:hypothetical protein
MDPTLRAAKSIHMKALAAAIRRNYGCAALQISSDDIRLRMGSRVVVLQVQTFQLVRSAAGDKCFAWLHQSDPRRRQMTVTTVLATPDIVTAEDAVRAYLAEAA